MKNFRVDVCTEYDYSASSMAENRDFLYELTHKLKPKTIVELGTYYGCSFFAFAEAIQDYQLDTQLHGVDTWEGDIHTQFYGGEVYNLFIDNFLAHYKDIGLQCTVHRKTFESALNSCFKPENINIDVLLIDGLPTYDAAKEDFESYLPRLSENGIVLFHDIKVEHFTLKEYWKELKEQYDYIEVNNTFGLGILFPKGSEHKKLVELLLNRPKIAVYTAIFGNYDGLKPVVKQTIDCDFICFTENFIAHDTDWQLAIAPVNLGHPRLDAKFFKVQPHKAQELLTYDYIIWVDGSADIKNENFVLEAIKQLGNDNLMVFSHPDDRDCIYQEAEYAKNMPKYINQRTIPQSLYYKKLGYPEHNGLYACGMLVMRLDPEVIKILDSWWKEITEWTIQDQISFPYVLWKHSKTVKIFPYNLWDNPYINFKNNHQHIW
jgi:predicted O-methyltransferase YrrM